MHPDTQRLQKAQLENLQLQARIRALLARLYEIDPDYLEVGR